MSVRQSATSRFTVRTYVAGGWYLRHGGRSSPWQRRRYTGSLTRDPGARTHAEGVDHAGADEVVLLVVSRPNAPATTAAQER